MFISIFFRSHVRCSNLFEVGQLENPVKPIEIKSQGAEKKRGV